MSARRRLPGQLSGRRMTVFRVPMSTRTRPWRVVWRTSFGLPAVRCFETHAQAIRWARRRAARLAAAQNVTQRDYALAGPPGATP